MDTKWKNIEENWGKIEKVWGMRRNSKVRIVLTVLFGAGGLAALFRLWWEALSVYHDWKLAWIYGIGVNLFLGIALLNGIKCYLEKHYKATDAYEEEFFGKWQAGFRKQQKVLRRVFFLALVAAILIYVDIYWSDASWMVLIVPLVQFILAEATVIRFMNRYLSCMMEQHMTELESIWQKKIKEATQAAVRSERMKVDLISNVSHDLKTPLTSMVGYIELLKKEELSDVVADYVEVLGNKAQKLKEMIDSLFDLAKTSSGNIRLNMERIELNRLIEQVQADMEDKFREADREIVKELTEEETGFISDSSYMYRVCQNLMENALKYSAEHTRIFFKTARVQQNGRDMVRFEVTNTANYRMNFTREQIVERFARGDEARTTEGNGLGLAIVSTYTSALGGSFDVIIDCDQFRAAVEFPV